MDTFLFGASFMLICGIVSLFLKKKQNLAAKIGFTGISVGCILPLFFFFANPAIQAENFSFLVIGIPPLIILAPCCALHALDYIHERKNTFWFFFNILVASILSICVFGMRSPILFLVLWEIMGASSFALVAFEFEKSETKKAAWLYILSAVAGALILILMFALQPRTELIFNNEVQYPDKWLLISILAIIGFGLKCGLWMIHFWLPSAHAAAPAPVSALMSGAMNNLGILAILQIITFNTRIGESTVVGSILLILGICGSLGAIIYALAQNHLKRLIAYSSVENFAIMALAIGLPLFFEGIGKHYNLGSKLEYAATLSAIGAIFHMYNHSALKGMLFLSAGAVHIGAHTYSMDKLGGLIKKMPFVGSAFTYGTLGISGLPPLNAFLSELFIYAAAISALSATDIVIVKIVSLSVIISLALMGGVASAVFTKAVGTIFLGEPRSKNATDAINVPKKTKVAIGILGLASIVLLFAPLFVNLSPELAIPMQFYYKALALYAIFAAVSAAIILLLCLGKKKELDGKGPTWDCGYAKPTAKMQYTGNSFSLPLADFFGNLLKTRSAFKKPEGLFPEPTKREFDTEDFAIRTLWTPLFKATSYIAEKAHHLQSGHLHLYILFIVIAIALMLTYAFI